jgi:hypothetical protein
MIQVEFIFRAAHTTNLTAYRSEIEASIRHEIGEAVVYHWLTAAIDLRPVLQARVPIEKWEDLACLLNNAFGAKILTQP